MESDIQNLKQDILDLKEFFDERLSNLANSINSIYTIMDRLDNVLFRQNGGNKSIVKMVLEHDEFISELKKSKENKQSEAIFQYRELFRSSLKFVAGILTALIILYLKDKFGG